MDIRYTTLSATRFLTAGLGGTLSLFFPHKHAPEDKHTQTDTQTHTHSHTHTNTYTHPYIHTHTHKHTYTHKHIKLTSNISYKYE